VCSRRWTQGCSPRMTSTLEQRHGTSLKYNSNNLVNVTSQEHSAKFNSLVNMAPSRESVAFTSTKGLLNGPGQNNCFLNSAVQVSQFDWGLSQRRCCTSSCHSCQLGTSKLAQAVTPLTCIWKVLRSNPGLDTHYPDQGFSSFFSDPPSDC
jgi:hypothetical protein